MTDSTRPDDKAEHGPSTGDCPEILSSPDRREFLKLAGTAGGLSSFALISSCAIFSGPDPRYEDEEVDLGDRKKAGYDFFFVLNASADNLSINGNAPKPEKIKQMLHDKIMVWAGSLDPQPDNRNVTISWFEKHIHPHDDDPIEHVKEAIFIGRVAIDTEEDMDIVELVRTGGVTKSGRNKMNGFGQHMKDLLEDLGTEYNDLDEMVRPSSDDSDRYFKGVNGAHCRIWTEHTREKDGLLIKNSHTGEATC